MFIFVLRDITLKVAITLTLPHWLCPLDRTMSENTGQNTGAVDGADGQTHKTLRPAVPPYEDLSDISDDFTVIDETN